MLFRLPAVSSEKAQLVVNNAGNRSGLSFTKMVPSAQVKAQVQGMLKSKYCHYIGHSYKSLVSAPGNDTSSRTGNNFHTYKSLKVSVILMKPKTGCAEDRRKSLSFY